MTFGIWTIERADELTRLWVSGLSASQVAAQLGGITRNSVIGKVHRLGLQRRGSALPHENKPRQPRVRIRVTRTNSNGNGRQITAYVPAEQAALRCAEIMPRDIGLLDLEPNDCRHPYGEGPFTFCGHPKQPGSSYCTPHFHLTRGRGTASERDAVRVAKHLEAA